ncbi:hypothetical protein N7G274_003380 [Stereocaulon virgatum]|uniref:Uncharacterized protein n=1 Tax=Stereocaulon virgatum TaxID=373712 RepID=A0ABR4AFG1_9LECA
MPLLWRGEISRRRLRAAAVQRPLCLSGELKLWLRRGRIWINFISMMHGVDEGYLVCLLRLSSYTRGSCLESRILGKVANRFETMVPRRGRPWKSAKVEIPDDDDDDSEKNEDKVCK